MSEPWDMIITGKGPDRGARPGRRDMNGECSGCDMTPMEEKRCDGSRANCRHGNAAMTSRRILYVSPLDLRSRNGMNQQQQLLLSMLVSVYGDSVDLLSLGAAPTTARKWVRDAGLRLPVLDGWYAVAAQLNTRLWYGGGVILCNKLGWIDRFRFPLRTPLPRSWIERYALIVCYYPWGHRLLRLDRAGSKVIMDLGDVMADRHERIGVRRWISMAQEDERAILHSSRCIAVSQEDAEEFKRLYGVRPPVMQFVPPDANKLMQLASQERPMRLGFMGAPSYGNEEILRVLSHPEFLEVIAAAGVELVVAGGVCDTVDQSVLSALRRGGGRVLGRVPSTLDYYRQIGATLNPIGPSTGVKIKSVETLITGRSLITTRYGADPELYAAFPGQIAYTEWPIDPAGLGRLAVEVVRASPPADAMAARIYVDKASEALRELHRL